MKRVIYISLLFFFWYWLLLAFGNANLNPDDTMWAITGEEPREWMLLYYLCPIGSFIGAALASGIIRAISWVKPFPWRRIIAFIIVFWVLDHSAFFTNFYYWNIYFNGQERFTFIGLLSFLLETLFSFHEFTAPVIAIVLTVFIVHKTELFLLTPEQYLLELLSREEFIILKNCLNRLDLDYGHLFWFMEDARVHHQMELCTEDKGFASVGKAFTNKERSVIRKAEDILSVAPVSVTEELRSFCHF